MTDEMRQLDRRARDLEPLAYFYERYEYPLFKVCHELYHEYRRLAETLKQKSQ